LITHILYSQSAGFWLRHDSTGWAKKLDLFERW